jgi:hypothetical protein
MKNSPEQLDEMIRRYKAGEFSGVQTSSKPDEDGLVSMVSLLNDIPKANVPKADLTRIKTKILDRISLPSSSDSKALFGIAALRFIPRFIRITGGVVGGFMILLSLTIGTAVAALESIPGQTIYPVKKIVENVQLQLANTEEQKTNLQIKFANNRVDELETILQKQKEGKVSDAQVQKVVVNTVKDIQKTSENVSAQSKIDPKVDLLTKIVNLSNKQSAIIQAAQVDSEGEVKLELEKALEVTKITKEQAIENIERAGLVVENDNVIVIEEEKLDEDDVMTQGKLTAVSATSLSIGSAQFLLTKTTEYVNIKPVDLKVGVIVKITGEIKDKKTYATKVEFETPAKPAPTPTPIPETEEQPSTVVPPAPTGTTVEM